jgi:hypothetical protein
MPHRISFRLNSISAGAMTGALVNETWMRFGFCVVRRDQTLYVFDLAAAVFRLPGISAMTVKKHYN